MKTVLWVTLQAVLLTGFMRLAPGKHVIHREVGSAGQLSIGGVLSMTVTNNCYGHWPVIHQWPNQPKQSSVTTLRTLRALRCSHAVDIPLFCTLKENPILNTVWTLVSPHSVSHPYTVWSSWSEVQTLYVTLKRPCLMCTYFLRSKTIPNHTEAFSKMYIIFLKEQARNVTFQIFLFFINSAW